MKLHGYCSWTLGDVTSLKVAIATAKKGYLGILDVVLQFGSPRRSKNEGLGHQVARNLLVGVIELIMKD